MDLSETAAEGPLAQQRLERLELLHRIGIALSAEKNRDRLLELILHEAEQFCHAEGGTLYLRTEEQELSFAIVHNESLHISWGGTSPHPVDFPPLPLFHPDTGQPNLSNVASYAVHEKRPVHVADAYSTPGFDFTGTHRFDRANSYKSTSLFTIPLVNSEDWVIGVIQLVNARDPKTGAVCPFSEEQQHIVLALASQAALALDNQLLLEAQKELLESFIKLIAAAIDSKSPYTGGHCERVPLLTEMLLQAACQTEEGSLRDFSLTDEEWYEARIAAWLHDCGKITTPVHIMDKATKLETITDRMETVRLRFQLLQRDALITRLQAEQAGVPAEQAEARYQATCAQLQEDLAFLEQSNHGGEFLSPVDQARIQQIGARTYQEGEQTHPLLTEEERAQLSISRGTLTEKERLLINGHMVETIRMLEALPFPRHLQRVPEYAGGHHERMDGQGYPKGLYAGDMSIPARALAIADVFEALTASDRPYKTAKSLSESMRIMGYMKRDNHLDPELFDLFVTSGVYKKYAEQFLSPELIDAVDEAALLAIQPRPYTLPPAEERKQRWQGFLPQYEALFPTRARPLPGNT